MADGEMPRARKDRPYDRSKSPSWKAGKTKSDIPRRHWWAYKQDDFAKYLPKGVPYIRLEPEYAAKLKGYAPRGYRLGGPPGLLDNVPYEISELILAELDVQSLCMMTGVNTATANRVVAQSKVPYKALVRFALPALAVLAKAGFLRHYLHKDLYDALCNGRCFHCGQFGALLNVASLHRMCLDCCHRVVPVQGGLVTYIKMEDHFDFEEAHRTEWPRNVLYSSAGRPKAWDMSSLGEGFTWIYPRGAYIHFPHLDVVSQSSSWGNGCSECSAGDCSENVYSNRGLVRHMARCPCSGTFFGARPLMKPCHKFGGRCLLDECWGQRIGMELEFDED